MSKTDLAMAGMVVLALVAPASARARDAPAEGAATAPGPAVAERVIGTMLQVELHVGYERAVLRVAGPRGYALTKRFGPGAPIEADLVAEAEERRANRAAASAGGPNPAEAARKRVPWTALPDGDYVYEVVLTDPAGGRQVHVGRFRVDTGVATPAERPRPEPSRAGGPSASASASASDGRVSEKAFTEADFIKIDDTGNDGTTFLTLDSDDGSNNPFETWGLFNRFGALIEGDVALGSTRTIKHAIEPVEPAAVLAAVRELPLYNWKYQADPIQALHIGPMAEDVHAIFQVGRDDEHLPPGDGAGLALAAVQGVDAELRRLRDELSRRLEELERLLAEARLLQALGPAEPGVCAPGRPSAPRG